MTDVAVARAVRTGDDVRRRRIRRSFTIGARFYAIMAVFAAVALVAAALGIDSLLGVLVLVGGAGFGLLLYHRTIAVPLKTVVDAMSAVAAGNLDVTVRAGEGRDEISALGRALATFREALRSRRDLETRQAQERTTGEAERRRATLDMCELLEAELNDAVAQAMEMSREGVSKGEGAVADARAIAGEAQSVASASDEANRSVAGVASSVAELSAAGREIARQAAQSTEIAHRAVAGAEEARTTMSTLNTAAEKIGAILKLIQDIAAQTNLLALNATIEAARAGEAGRGFAIVASEVKALATRTAEATEEIVARVEEITDATLQSVGVIDKIGQAVSEIDRSSAGVAAAVEQQEATLGEVARSMEVASRGTAAVAANVAAISSRANRVEEITHRLSDVMRQTDQRIGNLRANMVVSLRGSVAGDRRMAEPRVPIDRQARVACGGRMIAGGLRDISNHGASFRHADAAAAAREGDRVEIDIDGIGRISADVVAVAPGGLHLCFAENAPEIQARIKAVIDELLAADDKFVKAAVETAAGIGRLFEAALERREIDEAALFDTDYRLIAGSDPQQFETKFTALCDRLLPPLQEPLMGLDPRVVLCAAVDRNAYLPTHLRACSHPQRPGDRAWNDVHARNRRRFNDRASLSAARSVRPHLLQSYDREIGGAIITMKEVDAPIRVRGRHWGGFRLAYRA